MAKIPSVVSTKWLVGKLINRKVNKLAVLDGSWHMPATKRNPKADYLQKHIPSAQFFGIDDCCDKTTDKDHMLPKPHDFEAYVGNLGIDNETHVVIYDNHDSFGLFSAQRVWWTFRIFGHNLVSVLDGGLNKWIRDGFETTADITETTPRLFKVTFRQDLIKNYEDIQNNFSNTKFTLLDARASGRFNGTAPEPREGIPSGHMPRAVNIPFTEMLDPDTKLFKSAEQLQQLFDAAGIDLSKPLVGSCGTGISACMLALGAFQLGKEDFAVYDGSWTEYAQRATAEQILTNY